MYGVDSDRRVVTEVMVFTYRLPFLLDLDPPPSNRKEQQFAEAEQDLLSHALVVASGNY